MARQLVRRFIKSVFTPVSIGREDALTYVEQLAAITHLTSSAEYLARPKNMEEGSLGDWRLNRERFSTLGAWQMCALDTCSRPVVTKAIHWGRIGASLTLLAPSGKQARAAANGYLALTSALLYPRHHYGTDGSDQVSFQSSTVVFVARTVPNAKVQDAALWYLALQSGLAYGVSGWVKLFGPSWRSGQAVPGVMRTVTYGHKGVWEIFEDRPRLAATAAHAMLLAEGLFPLVFFSKGRLARPFLTWATLFHTFIGASMGLGRFATSFGSMLPAVAYATNERAKSAALPKAAGCMVGGAIVAGVVSAARRRVRIKGLRHSSVSVTTSSGNELIYTWAPGPDDDAPVLILEHGMLSTPEHFAWIVEALPRTVRTVTYARAGYGASGNTTGTYGIEESADDLVDLINDLPRGTGPVFLAGHSLGGLIVRRAAQVCNRTIEGIIYIDSSHPAQLARSSRQRDGAVQLSQAFQGLSGSMRLGFGWLLERPTWLNSLPCPVQDIVLAQYRDAKLWTAGRAEWRSTQRYFAQARNQSLVAMDIPALVISAQKTLDADEVQAVLHAELAGSHRQAPWTTEVVIPGATHDSLLTNSEHASEVAEAIAEFLEKSGAAA